MAITLLRPYQNLTTIVFIDGSLSDLQTILSGLDPSVTAIVLDPAQDGIQQMADALAGMSGLDAIHIISHGSSGQINLGTAQLSQDTLAQYQTQLVTIGQALTDTGDLLLYGCNVAQGAQGQDFITALSSATGADVAASTDLTGAAFLGGNWQLESSIGPIESAAAISRTNQEEYSALLQIINQSPSYDLGNAYDLMALSVAAYQDGAILAQTLDGLGWSPITSIHPSYAPLDVGGGYASSNAYAFAATRDFGGKHQMVISFRGTEPTQLGDIWSDIGAWGFTDYYKNVRPLLEEAIRQAIDSSCDQIFITGHSLGGAAAQLAMLDLMLPLDTALWTTSIWPHIAADRLGTNDRIGSSGGVQFSSSDWDWLHQFGRITGATIGAPDVSVDPYKLTAPEAAVIGNIPLAIAATEALVVIAAHAAVSTFGYDINNSLGSAFFRFEQANDIVAAVGLPWLNEVGPQVDIDLNSSLLSLYPIVPHSSNAYTESVLRAIFNYPLISSASTLTDTLVTLPYQPAGTSGNDLLLGSSIATLVLGGNGNDILVGTNTCILSGGGGNDIYVVNAPGCNITITGSTNDTGDRLFLGSSFNPSDLGVTESGANLVLTFRPSGGTESIITVQNWFSSISTYELAQISFLNGDPYRATGPEPYLTLSSYGIGLTATNPATNLGIPLFLTGAAGNDQIIGSLSSDTMTGGAGNDNMNGRNGNDTICGGAGADTLQGASGADTFTFDATSLADGRNGTPDRIADYDQGNSITYTYAAVEGDTIDLTQLISALYLFGTATPLNQIVRAQADLSGTYSTLDVLSENTNTWISVAQLDGIRAGNTLKVALDPNNTGAAPIDVTVGGNSTGVGAEVAQATWSITPGITSVTESNTDIVFTVTRSSATVEQIVYISTTINQGSLNQGDYKYWLDRQVTFAVGQTSYDVAVGILDDSVAESSETFGLIVQKLSTDPISGSIASATFTINDNDVAPPDPGVGVSWTGTVASEVWTGTNGHDYAYGTGGDDTLTGNDGNDELIGSSGNDTLSGGAGNDNIFDTGGANTMLGGDGNDAFSVSGAGANTIDGGAGVDRLYLDRSDLATGVTVNVLTDGNGGTSAISLPDGATASGIELLRLYTGSGDDQVTFTNTTTPGYQSWYAGAGNDSAVVDFSAFSSDVAASDYYNDYHISAVGWNHQVYLSGVEHITLYGGSGNDSMIRSPGNNTLIGNDGNDYLFGGAGNDYLSGGTGDDTLYADSGNNLIDGGMGNDTLDSRGGSNTLLGGDGNDTISISGAGANTIDGGAGVDRLYFYRYDLTTAATVNVLTDGNGGTSAISLPEGTIANGVELLDIYTGSGDDQVTFTNTTVAGSQSWFAGDGNDSAVLDFSAFSSDVSSYDYGTNITQGFTVYRVGTQSISNWSWAYQVDLMSVENITLYGGSGNDSMARSGGNNTLTGNDGNDDIRAGTGNDYLSGGAGNDTLSDNGGINTLLGGDGNDTISVSSSGANTIDGGAGTDTLILNRGDLTTGVTVNVLSDGNGGTNAISLPDGATASGIELLNLYTGSGDDQVTFTNTTVAGSQFWDASLGNDSAVVDFSAFSSDVSTSDYGYYNGSYYHYRIITQSDAYQVNLYWVENVTLYGGSGNDYMARSSGNNTMTGNDGHDTLSAGTGNDYLSGGAGDDYLSDTGGTNTLLGGDGNDTISVSGSGANNIDGGAGIDTITGGAGIDTLTGGGGNDVFAFAASGNGLDTITDFSAGDSITVAGAAFAGIIAAGDGSTVMANQIQLTSAGGTTTLYIGTDTVAGADVQIQLTGTFAANAFALYSNTIALNNTPTGSVTISGTATQGQTLTANTSTLVDIDGLGAIGYQWQANGATIMGATNDTLVLAEADVGKIITVAASYTDGHGTAESVASTSTMAVWGCQIGSGANDKLVGTTYSDILEGGDGNDLLNGGKSADTMSGGNGNDLYFVDHRDDQVIELANDTGIDMVIAKVDYTLPDNVENLMLNASVTLHGPRFFFSSRKIMIDLGIDGIGNDQDNILYGNRGNNDLTGNAGNDTLFAGSGADNLTGGIGADRLWGGAGADTFIFAAGNGGISLGMADVIFDFKDGTDRIGLAGGLGFADLSITQGNGSDTLSTNTVMATQSGEYLAVLVNLQSSQLTANDFVMIV